MEMRVCDLESHRDLLDFHQIHISCFISIASKRYLFFKWIAVKMHLVIHNLFTIFTSVHRMYDQPTPKLYNEKNVHHWKGQTAHIFLPASSLHGLNRV